jgi:hypothetical protein
MQSKQQLDLYSTHDVIQYEDHQKLVTVFKEHYHKVTNVVEMKPTREGDKAVIIIVKNYGDDFWSQISEEIATITHNRKHALDNLLNTAMSDVVSRINGQFDACVDNHVFIDKFCIQTRHLNCEENDAFFSVYTGPDNYKLSLKWLYNGKPQGYKTDIVIDSGDAYFVVNDSVSAKYSIGETFVDGDKKAKATAKAKTAPTTNDKIPDGSVKKTEIGKLCLGNQKIYTPRGIKANGVNGKELRVAIHKETRKVYKKFEKNWTAEGHAKFNELFPDGISEVKRNKKKQVATVTKEVVQAPPTAPTVPTAPSTTQEDAHVTAPTPPGLLNTTITEETEDDVVSLSCLSELGDFDLDFDENAGSEMEDDVEEIVSGTEEEVVECDSLEINEASNKKEETNTTYCDEQLTSSSDEESDGANAEPYTDELQSEQYDEPAKNDSTTFKLQIHDIINIGLLRATIPKSITLCDECGEITEEREVYLLTDGTIQELSIGTDHRIGNRVYGFQSKFPIYNLLSM